MSGISASLTTVGLDDAIAKLSRVAGFEMAELAHDAGGSILESSTRGAALTARRPRTAQTGLPGLRPMMTAAKITIRFGE